MHKSSALQGLRFNAAVKVAEVGHGRGTLSSINSKALDFIQRKGEKKRILHSRDVRRKSLYNLC